MGDGNIFKSIDTGKITALSQTKGCEPIKIHGAAELPRDGKWYWAAITGWINWGKLAKFSCEVKPENFVDVTTDNVSTLNIFIPFTEIDKDKPLILKINGQETFKGKLNGYSELICKYTGEKGWEIEKDTGTAETFKYSKKIIGETKIALTREGDDPLIGCWKADVLRETAKSDIAIIIRSEICKDLGKGDITLEDIFDMNYRNLICTFKIKGETLHQMMDFNIKLPESQRCQVSGFHITYEIHENIEENSVIESSLALEKEYFVAISDYLAKRSKRFFGREVEYRDTRVQVNDAMIQWLEQYKRIEKIEPRIKMVKSTQ